MLTNVNDSRRLRLVNEIILSENSVVPATPYIVSIQVLLVAASAAYMSSDRRGVFKNSAAATKVRTQWESDDTWSPSFLEDSELARYARSGRGEDPVQAHEVRSMGFRMGDVERAGELPPPHTALTEPEFSGRTHQRKGTLLQTDATEVESVEWQLPNEELEKEFDLIPSGAGYTISADSASNFDLASRTVVFSGNVVLTSSSFVMRARELVVHLEGEGQAMKQMMARGDVDVQIKGEQPQDCFRGFGREAHYDPGSESITMMGSPRIIGHGREHQAADAGTQMKLFMNPSRLVTNGRSLTRILPGEDDTLASQ